MPETESATSSESVEPEVNNQWIVAHTTTEINSGSVMGPSSEAINASVTQLVDIFELQYLGKYLSHWAETWNLVLFWPKLWIIIKKQFRNSDFFTS